MHYRGKGRALWLDEEDQCYNCRLNGDEAGVHCPLLTALKMKNVHLDDEQVITKNCDLYMPNDKPFIRRVK